MVDIEGLTKAFDSKICVLKVEITGIVPGTSLRSYLDGSVFKGDARLKEVCITLIISGNSNAALVGRSLNGSANRNTACTACTCVVSEDVGTISDSRTIMCGQCCFEARHGKGASAGKG